jgi:hypothetical protein
MWYTTLGDILTFSMRIIMSSGFGISRSVTNAREAVMFACGDEIYGVTILATAKIIHKIVCVHGISSVATVPTK